MLTNPVWNALISRQASISEGNDLARRFPADIGPFAGLHSLTPEAWNALKPLVLPNDPITVPLNVYAAPPDDWELLHVFSITQMVLEQPLPSKRNEKGLEPMALTSADVPDMLALTELTKPGPFRQRTQEVGRYIGFRENGRLVAMAGERMQLDGYTEISAVCTHPEFAGRGYASQLMTAVAQGILADGHTPFLHVLTENVSAIHVYEKLGFRTVRPIWAVLAQPHL